MSVSGSTVATSANPLPNQNKEGNAWHEFDILAAVVSRYQNAAPKKPQSPEHRISCHRCGNIRKRRILCTRSTCPHTFCGRCAEKMKEEHGLDVFFGGCPVCKELCCCNNKSVFCHRKNHCYRKCPATKTNGKHANNNNSNSTNVKDDSDSEPYQEEIHSIPKPENGQYGIFDLLAAVADMDKANPTLCRPTKSLSGSAASGAPPRKKPKQQGKDSMSSGGGKGGYPSNMLLGEPSYAPYFSGSSSLTDSAGTLQMLQQKPAGSSSLGLSGDTGVDGYTFNNNTMGIIPGGISNVDAITLMGQQKQRFPNAMDKLNMTLANDHLLSSISASASCTATPSTASASSAAATGNLGIYNRLPSIDSNPFSTTNLAKDANHTTPTFDQALLDSVRNIQADPYHQQQQMSLGHQLPSVPPRSGTASNSAAPAPSPSPGVAAVGAGSEPTLAALNAESATKPSADPKAVSAASLEPMNLLALVSSFTQSLDKSTHLLPTEHLFLGTTAPTAIDGGKSTQAEEESK